MMEIVTFSDIAMLCGQLGTYISYFNIVVRSDRSIPSGIGVGVRFDLQRLQNSDFRRQPLHEILA